MTRRSSAGASRAAAIEVVIDTPKGSRNKYKLDEARGVFLLHKLLPLGDAFPFDFGYVPDTRGDDGDALDVLVLGEEPTFTGCHVTVRLLGVIEAEQREKGRPALRNDRLIAVPETDKIRPVERSLGDLRPRVLDQIEHFFAAYNRAEGREFVVLERGGPCVATRLVEEGRQRHRAGRRSERRLAGNARGIVSRS
jgi:inorganic pyrophosphatase